MATPTYTFISTFTVSTPVHSVSFDSIPATYTDLVLTAKFKQDSDATITDAWCQLNSDGGSNYSRVNLAGNGSSAAANATANMDRMYWSNGPVASNWGNNIWHFMNYSASTYKTALLRGNLSSQQTVATAYLWRSTAAINTILIGATDGTGPSSGDNWSTGTIFTLYGIKAA